MIDRTDIFSNLKVTPIYIDGTRLIRIEKDSNILRQRDVYCFIFENDIYINIEIRDNFYGLNQAELQQYIIEELTIELRNGYKDIATAALKDGFVPQYIKDDDDDEEIKDEIDNNYLSRFQDILGED